MISFQLVNLPSFARAEEITRPNQARYEGTPRKLMMF